MMFYSLKGPRRILRWAAGFPRKVAKCTSGGEDYAHSEMVDHMALILDFYDPSEGPTLELARLEDC